MKTKARSKKYSKGVLVLYGIIVFSLLSAWLLPWAARSLDRLRPIETVRPRTAFTFMALVYSDSGTNLAGSMFARHIEALVANGYTPITLVDAMQLVLAGRALPANAVLLTVDSESTGTVAQLTPVLRRHNWNAVLCIATQPIMAGQRDALTWPRLDRLEKSARWEIATRGHRGIPMAGLTWANNPADESPTRLRMRIMEDVHNARQAFASNRGQTPRVFVFPEGQFGQLALAPDQATATAMDILHVTFRMAFTAGETGLNTVFSDPYRLNRLHVDPDWSGRQLLDHVELAFATPDRIEDLDRQSRQSAWMLDRGRMSRSRNGLGLLADRRGGATQAWLAGSNMRANFTATLDIIGHKGPMQIFLRANPQTGTAVEYRLSDDGTATVLQRVYAGHPPTVLASATTSYRPGREHRISASVQDNWLDIRIDGIPAFPDRIRLLGEPVSGLLGIRIENDSSDPAVATIRSARVEGRRPTVASWDLDPSHTPYVIDWLNRNASTLTGISPYWHSIAPDAASGDASQTAYPVLSQIARLYDLRIIPKVTITDEETLADWQPRTLADRAAAINCDGIYADFSEYRTVRADQLERWLRDTSRMLSGTGRPILIRLPPLMERLASIHAVLAAIPAVEIVTTPGMIVPGMNASILLVTEQPIPPPTPEQLRALPAAMILSQTGSDPAAEDRAIAIRRLHDAGEAAFLNGLYERAIESFSEWHELTPQSAQPLTRMGDALVNLGFPDEAIDFYRRSLERDPGQIGLAVRKARLLTSTHRIEEAREILNIYARLFPTNTAIMFAQAEWLFRQNRLTEARLRISRILRLNPDDFEATLFMIRLTDAPEERAEAIDILMAMGDDPDRHQQVLNAIWEYDLMTLPESHILVQLLERIDTKTTNPRIHYLVDRLRPRTDMASETFENDRLSDAWLLDGARIHIQDNTATVTATPDRSEFLIRLLRSERWRDSFFEVDLVSVTGAFWIHARRSRDHLVRFGVDPRTRRIHLQVWKGRHNDVVLAEFVPWESETISGRFRLEIRGNGILALMDGRPIFESILPLPDDIGLGWSALTAHSTVLGDAQLELKGLRAGPLPTRLAILPASPAEVSGADAELEQLRAMLPFITDFSPTWFTVAADGHWSSRPVAEDDFYRLFARYHRIRFVPSVRVAAGAMPAGADILTVIRTHRLNGLVLHFETIPDAAWFDSIDVELREPGIDLIALIPTPVPNTFTMRNLAASRREMVEDPDLRQVPVIPSHDIDRVMSLTVDQAAVLDFSR